MAQQPKAAMQTNRVPSRPMGSADFLTTALRADASGVPLELAAPSAEAALAQTGRSALRDVRKESQKEAKAILREAKKGAGEAKVEDIKATGEAKIQQAASAGTIGFLQQLARAELTRMKEEEAENLANLKQAAKDGRDSFFDFLDAAQQKGIEFESRDINDALRLVPGAERERRLAREVYKQEPVDFTRGEDYRRELARRAFAEDPEFQADVAAARVALQSLMNLPDDSKRPEFRQPPQPSFLAAQEGVLAGRPALANPFEQPEFAALNLARSKDSILNPQGSRAVGAAAKELKLREGAEGAEVLEAQKALKALPGFEKVSLVDGKYDESFKNAVIAFQKSQGLSPDGVIGPNTYEALFRELYNRAEIQERVMLNLRDQRQQEATLASQLFGGMK